MGLYFHFLCFSQQQYDEIAIYEVCFDFNTSAVLQRDKAAVYLVSSIIK